MTMRNFKKAFTPFSLKFRVITRAEGFTLLESIVIGILIAIVGSIAIPMYLGSMERGKLATARDAMGQIAQAEHMYALEHDYAFIACGDTAAVVTNLNGYIELNELQANDFPWNFVVTTGAGTFLITATTKVGRNTAETLTFDQAGVWGGNFTP